VAALNLILSSLLMLAAPGIVAADGQWATLSQGRTCEAAAKSVGVTYKDRLPARASLSFDAGGPRHGQFAARLSRMPRPGATVMLHYRRPGPSCWSARATWRGAAARSRSRRSSPRCAPMAGCGSRQGVRGGRIVDRYSLDGAPLAIDAAAACSAALANR
jgi:hypothetical protein